MAAKKREVTSGQYNRAEILVCEKKFGLALEQQVEIRQKYKSYKSLLQLAKDVFKDAELTEDTEEFKNVKNFVTRVHTGTEVHNFSESEIEFISANGELMRPMDITRILFPNAEGTPMKECKSVMAVLGAFDLKFGAEEEKPDFLGPYQPPKADHKIIALINKADPEASYHIAKLDPEKRRRIATVKKSLNLPRVVAMISAIRTQMHRDVFESQFISYIIDKENLSFEDVSTCANLANETIHSLLITDTVAALNDRLSEAAGDNSEDSKRFTKSLSDSLAAKSTEYNSCQSRMASLHKTLADTRANRMKYQIGINESLAKYIELAKTKEGRDYMLKLKKIREEQIEAECNRIASLDELVAEIRGTSISEILKF